MPQSCLMFETDSSLLSEGEGGKQQRACRADRAEDAPAAWAPQQFASPPPGAADGYPAHLLGYSIHTCSHFREARREQQIPPRVSRLSACDVHGLHGDTTMRHTASRRAYGEQHSVGVDAQGSRTVPGARRVCAWAHGAEGRAPAAMLARSTPPVSALGPHTTAPAPGAFSNADSTC